MKIFTSLICVMSLVLAEPPVDEGYPSARSSHDHSHDHEHDHSNDFQRSLSQEYGPPPVESARSVQKNDVSREYLPPNEKSANFRSGVSPTYGSSNIRSRTSHSDVQNSRATVASRRVITKHGAPNTRSGSSQTNGISSIRSNLSQEYGVPSVRSNNAKALSTQNGVPEEHMSSEDYRVPSQRSSDGLPSQKYGAPKARTSKLSGIHSARSGKIQSHSSLRSFAKSFASSSSRSSKVSPKFGPPSSSTGFRSRVAKNSYPQDTLSQTYRAPNQPDQSNAYEVPTARGVPASLAANQKTSAIASPHFAARSTPSNKYGAPLARGSNKEQHGIPEQNSNISNDGYAYARNNTLNEEPASYDFSYKVENYESGSDFGHTETRQDNRAEGAYFVVLPDGTKQVVEYEADERGFKPRISVEPADFARSAGYDHNAAELARSGDGPY